MNSQTDTLSKIIRDRGAPGILLFDLYGQLIFANDVAVEMQVARQSEGAKMVVCDSIKYFCSYLVGTSREDTPRGDVLEYQVLLTTGNLSYSVRPFLIGDEEKGKLETSILLLVEKVVSRHEIDLVKSQREFHLTKREAQIAGLICRGFSNKEISTNLFISEFTVKNHIKKIMCKTGGTSRNQVFTLLQSYPATNKKGHPISTTGSADGSLLCMSSG